ncbi:LysR family transcriptional regulator [Novosphingobium resinovorum]
MTPCAATSACRSRSTATPPRRWRWPQSDGTYLTSASMPGPHPVNAPLNALRAFEAVARHRSFLLAARELGVTPSAVGQLVARLEKTWGWTFSQGRAPAPAGCLSPRGSRCAAASSGRIRQPVAGGAAHGRRQRAGQKSTVAESQRRRPSWLIE